MTTPLLVVLTALIIVSVAAYVLGPLLESSGGEVGALPESAEGAAHADRREAALAALRDVELEYHLGNLTEADYRQLRERYYRRALASLRGRPPSDGLDEDLERQIAALRVPISNE